MKVKDIIKKLQEFNENADFTVIFDNKEYNADELVWDSGGDSDSNDIVTSKKSSISVSLYINSSTDNI